MADRVKITRDNLQTALDAVKRLTDREILVGIPATNAPRKGEPITNATIGYVMEFGSPAKNIPPRPFLLPGMRDASERITKTLVSGGRQALQGDPEAVERSLNVAGLIATSAIKKRINDGIPPPLSRYTLEERARRGRKGAKAELDRRDKGLPEGLDLAKPLVDTGQLRNSITYVVRGKGD